MTGRVRDMIMDPEQTGKLHEVIAEGGYYGMQTFDQALLAHLKAGRITMEQALKAATHPHDFKLLVAADGNAGHHDGGPRPGEASATTPAARPQPRSSLRRRLPSSPSPTPPAALPARR